MTNIYYGKLENGELVYAQNPLWIEGKMVSNPKEETYIYLGYKHIEYTEHPIKDGYYYMPVYEDIGDKIIQSWEEFIDDIPENLNTSIESGDK